MKKKLFTDIISGKGTNEPIRIFDQKPKPRFAGLSAVYQSSRPAEAEHFTYSAYDQQSSPGTRRIALTSKSWHLGFLLGFGILVIFAVNLLLVYHRGLELKGNVALATKAGFESLVSAGSAFQKTDLKNAIQFFEHAQGEFESVEKDLWFLKKSALRALEGGKLLAEAGILFTQTAEKLQVLPQWFFENRARKTNISSPSITEYIKGEIPQLKQAASLVKQASSEFENATSSHVPKEFRSTFYAAKKKLALLASEINQALEFLPAILNLLGDERPHRFLILSQNRNETRPTGGFVGSYILATMNDGYLTEFEAHDTYSSDYLLQEIIPPPEEYRPLLNRWFMRDCNYHIDFAVSAERCAWFLQKEAGPSVDSVLAIDQTVVENLLRVAGPIFFEPLNQFITAENFSFIFSYVTEAKLAGREDPKKLLKDFVTTFKEELFAKADFAKIAEVVKKAVREKHLMAFSRESEVQGFFEAASSAGRIVTPSNRGGGKQDFLAIVNYSIGGNKSDEFLKQKVVHETFITPQGIIEDVLTIHKTHTWNRDIEESRQNILKAFGFAELDEKLRWILGRGNNFSAMRIYVPRGSELLSSEENPGTFEVISKEDPEFPDKTSQTREMREASQAGETNFLQPNSGSDTNYFSTKMDVKAGRTVTLKIRYRLPWRFETSPAGEYRFLFIKQPGQKEVELEKHVIPRLGLTLLRQMPKPDLVSKDQALFYQKTVREDFSLATLWK